MADDAPEQGSAPSSSQGVERVNEAPPATTGPPARRWLTRRTIGLGIALLALCCLTAVNVVLIVAASPPQGEAAATASLLQAAHVADPLKPISQETSSLLPKLEEEATRTSPPSDEKGAEEPSEPKPEEPRRYGTVQQAAARSCSTSSVDGLSRQIIAQARCIDPDAFVPVPARPNLVTGSRVFLYLDAAARDRLVRVLDAHRDQTMTVNSALRTVAQQYLLFRWSAGKRCGIKLATPPGESNHETGLALDIAQPGVWRSALEAAEFRWLGSIDKVHFDYRGAGASSRANIDVMAFQQLWNRNHPDDAITETGRYNPATEQRLKKSPAGGFPTGARCDKARGSGGR